MTEAIVLAIINGIVAIVTVWQGKKTRKEVRKEEQKRVEASQNGTQE